MDKVKLWWPNLCCADKVLPPCWFLLDMGFMWW